MTDAEVEELIAEFKLADKNWTGGVSYGMGIEEVEKIIKRFANKPDKYGYTTITVDQRSRCSFKLNLNIDFLLGYVTFRVSDNNDGGFITETTLTLNELQSLRDNCNKMLAYLDGKKADTYKDIVQGHQL